MMIQLYFLTLDQIGQDKLLELLYDEDFDGFKRDKKVDTFFVTMTQYDKTIENVMLLLKQKS